MVTFANIKFYPKHFQAVINFYLPKKVYLKHYVQLNINFYTEFLNTNITINCKN